MKKTFFALLLIAASFTGIKAQYYTYRYDPFVNGDKSIGLSLGLGGWFSSPNYYLNVASYSTSSPYYGFEATELSRSILNPGIMINYKRVLEGRTISWGNNYYLGFHTWNGEVKGKLTSSPNTTFTTKYHSYNVDLTSIYYAIYNLNDKIDINAGIGLTIGINLLPKSTIEYSDGRQSVDTKGGLDFMDMLKANIDFMVGADYHLNDAISLNCNLIGYPIDFFGSINSENEAAKGMRGVGEGLYVTKKFPFQLTLGFTYAL